MTTPAIGGRWEARRLLAILTAFAVAATVIMVFSGTARADSPGTLPWDEDKNAASWWEGYGAGDPHFEDDWTCVKDETGDDEPYTIGDPPSGEVWRLAVVKAGSDFVDLFWDPSSGDEVEHSGQGGWSWVILCSRPGEVTTTTEATTSSTSQPTTSSSVSDTTVTTAESTTSTTASVSGSTVTTGESTTIATVEGTVVTTAPAEDPDDELPFTGIDAEAMLGITIALLGSGVALLTLTRKLEDNN